MEGWLDYRKILKAYIKRHHVGLSPEEMAAMREVEAEAKAEMPPKKACPVCGSGDWSCGH